MSANNVWIIAKVGDKYYGWNETAEEIITDVPDGGRVCYIKSADASGDSVMAVNKQLVDQFNFAEYGVNLSPVLPDGTKVIIKGEL
jgi:hypothetical protein